MDFDAYIKYIWLAIVAFIGAVTGYLSKVNNTDSAKGTKGERIKLLTLGVITSMFISYITYEFTMYMFHATGLSVAMAGLASFTGTDLVVAMEKGLIDFIDRKFKQL